jgi:hypothetical protein
MVLDGIDIQCRVGKRQRLHASGVAADHRARTGDPRPARRQRTIGTPSIPNVCFGAP